MGLKSQECKNCSTFLGLSKQKKIAEEMIKNAEQM
jgi:hypothetical protein